MEKIQILVQEKIPWNKFWDNNFPIIGWTKSFNVLK